VAQTYKRADALRDELKDLAGSLLDAREVRQTIYDGFRVYRTGSRKNLVDTAEVKRMLGVETPMKESVSTWVEVRPCKKGVDDE